MLGPNAVHPGESGRLEGREGDVASFTSRFAWHPSDDRAVTPIVRLDDTRGWAIAAIDRRGQHVAATIRSRGGTWRFRDPVLAVRPVETPTTTARISLGGGLVALVADSASLSLPFGAQHGWVRINPFAGVQHDIAGWRTWTLLWLLGWGMLLGWATSARQRLLAWGAVATLALVATTQWAGAPATPAELLAFVAGWLPWWLSSRRSRRSPAGA
jgi:hypothetical protein